MPPTDLWGETAKNFDLVGTSLLPGKSARADRFAWTASPAIPAVSAWGAQGVTGIQSFGERHAASWPCGIRSRGVLGSGVPVGGKVLSSSIRPQRRRAVSRTEENVFSVQAADCGEAVKSRTIRDLDWRASLAGSQARPASSTAPGAAHVDVEQVLISRQPPLRFMPDADLNPSNSPRQQLALRFLIGAGPPS